MNTYECRIQGGKSSGSCALGFGVCCVCKFLQNFTIRTHYFKFTKQPCFPKIVPKTRTLTTYNLNEEPSPNFRLLYLMKWI